MAEQRGRARHHDREFRNRADCFDLTIATVAVTGSYGRMSPLARAVP